MESYNEFGGDGKANSFKQREEFIQFCFHLEIISGFHAWNRIKNETLTLVWGLDNFVVMEMARSF